MLSETVKLNCNQLQQELFVGLIAISVFPFGFVI